MIKKWQEEQDWEEVFGLPLDPEEVWEWATLIHSAGTSRGFPDGGGQECIPMATRIPIRIITGGG
ncbi:hypothetical protein DRN97_06955 [Methanosarcinales archaeon]|nr:MAG: hypothetical protein DRN97_06955 [Methanosarcinales archaeon]